MGSCLSKANAVHPLEASLDVPNDHLPESRCAVEVPRPESPPRIVDPKIPQSFYPETVEISSPEEKCRLTQSKISAKRTEQQVRYRLQELLDGWRRNAVMEQIEAHALSIPAGDTVTVEKLALSLINPDAKYLKCLKDSAQIDLTVAKMYAIFFWISSNICFSPKMWRNFVTNPESLRSGAEAKHVLERRECMSKGHANLFHSLATAMGLKTCVVMGNIKIPRSDMHDPTEQFECTKLNQHWWNMVSISLCNSYV